MRVMRNWKPLGNSMKRPSRFDIRYKGHRYWAHLIWDTIGKRFEWNFWSDHDWPFYHGKFTQTKRDDDEAEAAFLKWLPFEVAQ